MATKDMRVLFFDKGLYTYTARKLGEFYSKVWYYMPESNAFPCSQFAEIGTGFPEIERVNDFWEYVDKADLIVFPDVHDGKMQAWLRNKGYRVFGSGKSEKLELDKIYHLECLEKAGLPVPYTEVIEGLDNLVSFLDGKKDRYIKTNTYRGDFETYHYVSMAHAKPWIDTLRLKLGVRADKAEFLVQKGIPAACEAGYDGFCVDGKYTENGLCGYEVKDRGFVCKVFEQTPDILSNINTKMAPFMSDCRGHFSSEVRITEAGKAYYLDPTQRIPSPPGELMSELYENYAEAFWQIAGGEVPKMKPRAKFGAEIILTSHWHTDHELCVEYPSEVAKFIKLKNDCRRGKYNYCIPNGDDEFFGAAVYYADTLQGAIDGCLDVAKQVEAHKFHVDEEMFKEAVEAVKSGEKFGIKY